MADEETVLDRIKEIKTRFVDTLYTSVRKEQKIDETYIDDTFSVEEIHEPHHIYRAGLGVRIVDSPAEHIVTSNPQVFFHSRSGTKASIESALKLSGLVNGHWLPVIQKQNPNIFKEFIKAQLGRGEAFFKVVHNESWVTGKKVKKGLPVRFIVLDPMVIYASPEEGEDGIPDQVVIYYQIKQTKDLIVKYPILLDRSPSKGDMVDWWEFYDSKWRYIEADGLPITKGGLQENIYRQSPFVRKYSGFGRRSPSGELSSLIVSDIRRSRDLIREECAMRSNMASILFLFAHKSKTLMTSGQIDVAKMQEEVQWGEYVWNVIQQVPPDTKLLETDIQLTPDVFSRHTQIVQELNQRHPFIMAGFPQGTSGRQQDMTNVSAMSRYDSTVENTEWAFATALKMALKLCAIIPGLKPEGVSQKDLETEFDVEVKLKAKDPIMEDRLITLGDRLWNSGKGSISLSRFHTEYQGLTEDESKKEIAKMLADQITIYNPDVAAVMGMVAAEESGMEIWLEKARQRREQMEAQPGLREPLPKTSVERIQGETETELGREMGTEGQRGARVAPSRYTREG